MFEELTAVARVAKTYGSKGEVVVATTNNLPFLLAQHMRVCILPPELTGHRWFTVKAIQGDDAHNDAHDDAHNDASAAVGATAHDAFYARSGVVVSFNEVTTMNQAQTLVGKTICVPTHALPEDVVRYNAADLIGTRVIDTNYGELGTIDDILFGPTQNVWVIQGRYGEILLPAVDEFIEGFDEAGSIRVCTPTGLIEKPDEGEKH